MATLIGVRTEIDRLAKLVEAPERKLPGYTPEYFGHPYVEVDHGGYHLVFAERGRESRFTTYNLDDLLYEVFKYVASTMSLDYVLSNPVKGQDTRRIAFKYRTEVLSKLSPQWAKRYSQEIDKILEENPFDDENA
jgi:hypothetical protein